MTPTTPVSSPRPVTPPAQKPVVAETPVADDPVARGELPWWHDLKPGVFRRGEQTVVLAVGHSPDHHHVAAGFLHSRVAARIAVRRAAATVGFQGTMPQPELSDLFITREQQFWALYELRVPPDAKLPAVVHDLAKPDFSNTRHRRGRHVFERGRHAFLDCEVEGPIANTDWGRDRATAFWSPR